MKFFNILLKWMVVIITALSAALIAIILLSANPSVNQFLLRLVILMGIGFTGGLLERLLFGRTNVIISFLMVLAAGAISILVVDLFYETPYQLNVFSAGFSIRNFSISDGSQLLLMSLMSLLPLLFMRKPSGRIAPAPTVRNAKPRKSLAEAAQPVLHQINPVNWQVFKLKRKPKQQKPRSSAKPASAAKPKPKTNASTEKTVKSASTVTIAHPSKKVKAAPKARPGNGAKPAKSKTAVRKLKIPSKLFGGNGGDVKLVGEEEHVCPYCLEEVSKGDAQGVVVCPECGTWHHQDCWNLTGSCGVAHRNEL
jgi:hypothetical protein